MNAAPSTLTPTQRRQDLADWLARHGVATHTLH
jgi:hypothetical protein